MVQEMHVHICMQEKRLLSFHPLLVQQVGEHAIPQQQSGGLKQGQGAPGGHTQAIRRARGALRKGRAPQPTPGAARRHRHHPAEWQDGQEQHLCWWEWERQWCCESGSAREGQGPFPRWPRLSSELARGRAAGSPNCRGDWAHLDLALGTFSQCSSRQACRHGTGPSRTYSQTRWLRGQWALKTD